MWLSQLLAEAPGEIREMVEISRKKHGAEAFEIPRPRNPRKKGV